MRFNYNDGGRAMAGYKGKTRDCVCRAISIATNRPYQQVYDALNELALNERKGKKKNVSNARTDVHRVTYQSYLESIGAKWTPTMKIGTGCKTHLKEDELPKGRLICSVSRHLVAVINGVINDTEDCSRNEKRCVYGYWTIPS